MNQDPEARTRKKVFATTASKLKEFNPMCLAAANAGSQVFLLLGDGSLKGNQTFKVVRAYDAGSLGTIEESIAEFEATWRFSALKCFKAILDVIPGGYAGLGFLRYDDMPARSEAPSPFLTRP